MKKVEIQISLHRRIANIWMLRRPRLRRAILPQPRPDFTQTEVVCDVVNRVDLDRNGGETHHHMYYTYFPQYPPPIAMYNRWFNSQDEYDLFAKIMYVYRYPNHPRALEVEKEGYFSWENICAIAEGRKEVTVVSVKY